MNETFRVVKRSVVIDRGPIEDTRLSWAARGVLAYYLTHPDQDIRVDDLVPLGNLPRKELLEICQELSKLRYLEGAIE